MIRRMREILGRLANQRMIPLSDWTKYRRKIEMTLVWKVALLSKWIP